jgi:ABC-type polysaccharide/polyol phosphate export permease
VIAVTMKSVDPWLRGRPAARIVIRPRPCKAAPLTDLLRHRDLVVALVVRDLRVRYKRSALGLLWTMLQPLLTMGVMVLVFSSIFRFDLPHYPVYCLTGILFWNFFSQSIVASMVSLRANAAILHKVPVPKAVFPVATVCSGVVNLCLALVPLAVILIATGHPLRPALLFLPVAILVAALFTLGMGLLLSPLAVFFTDVVEMVGVVLSLLMYMTPIFYPLAIVPEQFRVFVRFNPVRSILEVFRDPIYFGKIPPLTHFTVAFGLALLAFTLGAFAFKRNSDRIPFYV